MSSYRERLHGCYDEPGESDPAEEQQVAEEQVEVEVELVDDEQEQPAEDEENGERLPGRHAGLDALAAERGYTWSADELTIRQKREELAALE